MTVQSNNIVLKGDVASEGMAVGEAHILDLHAVNIPCHNIGKDKVDSEIGRLKEAILKSREQMQKLMQNSGMGDDLQAIFEAQLLLLEDFTLIEEIQEKIHSRQINAEWALAGELTLLKNFLLKSKDTVFQERAIDLEDIKNRVLANLLQIEDGDILKNNLKRIKEQTILLIAEIAPSLILRLPLEKIVGLAVEKGGLSSHATILARNYKLPKLIHVEDLLQKISTGKKLLLDAINGRLYLEPNEESLQIYHKYHRGLARARKKKQHIHSPVHTRDGSAVEIWVNLSEVGTEESTTLQGTSGVGLFRTEFLYLKNQQLMHSYSQQADIYRDILENLKDMTIHFRLLDVGDDKPLPREMLQEKDASLRGARFLLAHQWLLELQFKSILTAVLHTNTPDHRCRFIVPMISTLEEIKAIDAILQQVRNSLALQFLRNVPQTPLGIMVETPAAAVMVDVFSQKVDFLSIGSNDLARLSLAMERNESISGEDIYYQPALFRHLHQIIHKTNIPLSFCGEMAAQPEILPVLLGLGLRSISISPQSIARCSDVIQGVDMEQCCQQALQVLEAESATDIKKIL